MIDTIKIYCEIDKDLHDEIQKRSIVKVAFDCNKDSLLYNITNDHLEGSYSSSLSVRVGCGSKYHFVDLGYFLEVEGSYHKIQLGYNSHNGFYDLNFVAAQLIQKVSVEYDLELPDISLWYISRVDIAICYDLGAQDNVTSYINSLSRCHYPRRKMRFFNDESIYLSGTTTSLKIYNKLREFLAHDKKKFAGSDFDLESYCKEIAGFVRFECEIHKKKLLDYFSSYVINGHIKLLDINYDELRYIWEVEFMKLLNFVKDEYEIVRGREAVKNRLFSLYASRLASTLYNFYCAIMLNGLEDTKKSTSASTYYRNKSLLVEAGVDISQTYKIQEYDICSFSPFTSKEVA